MPRLNHIADIPELCNARLKGKNGHIYRFQRQVGAGQFGVVYRCIDEVTLVPYACKVINLASYTDCMKVVLREVEILNKIQHERLLTCHDQLCANNLLFLFLTYVKGGTLTNLLNERRLSFDEIGRIVYQILEGVAYLHEHSICHRDLKPDNILCSGTTPPDIVIADFGLSRTFEGDGLMSSQCGSSSYSAPEVFNSKYTCACDMWSVGIVTNEMVHGPYSGTPLGSLEFDSSVPEVVRNFIEKLLQYEPDKRMTAKEALRHEWMLQIAQKFFAGNPTSDSMEDDGGQSGDDDTVMS